MFRCAALMSRGAGLHTGRYAARLRGNGGGGSRGYDQVSALRRQRQILNRINAIPSPSTAAAAAASGAAAAGSTAAAAAAAVIAAAATTAATSFTPTASVFGANAAYIQAF